MPTTRPRTIHRIRRRPSDDQQRSDHVDSNTKFGFGFALFGTPKGATVELVEAVKIPIARNTRY